MWKVEPEVDYLKALRRRQRSSFLLLASDALDAFLFSGTSSFVFRLSTLPLSEIYQ